jgi:hypothetical protein
LTTGGTGETKSGRQAIDVQAVRDVAHVERSRALIFIVVDVDRSRLL